MNMTTARQWGWLGLLWFMCACGGQVTDDGGEQGQGGDDSQGASGQSSEGGGPGPGTTGGGGNVCAGTRPHQDYNLCYSTNYPPCLELSSADLPGRLGVATRPTIGPWAGTSGDCKMLCCYGTR